MKILSTTMVVIVGLVLLGCEKDRLDEEARELCARDGGVRVYENVILTSEAFDAHGVVKFWKPTAGEGALGPDYIFKRERLYYRKGNPEMWRVHSEIIRRSDGKLLSEEVSYVRRGGDIPISLGMHPSSFSCPPNSERGIIERTFVRSTKG